ncbi:hypothetical protein CBD41_02515 [bacterium TMED181]|nr:hypothetical protein [Planctomycetota bacterium]OUW46471.1 MAG: hypothetical protein CBD41_02515 [bacterium TMED181]
MHFQGPSRPGKFKAGNVRRNSTEPASKCSRGLLSIGILFFMICCGCDPVAPASSPASSPAKSPTFQNENEPPENLSVFKVALPDLLPFPEALPAAAEDLSPPRFLGLRQLIAGDGELILSWSMAIDDVSTAKQIRYQIFTADRSGKQDFSAPPIFTTAPGALSCRLTDLENSRTIHVVVRAEDATGKVDTNEIEWSATPNPVLFVDGSVARSGSGQHPISALKTIDEAIGAAIGMPGVNVYIAEGTYDEQFLLFDGMSLFGGFRKGFEVIPSLGRHPTILTAKATRDSLILPPGKNLVVIDGLTLSGAMKGRRAIVADDCIIRISHCSITGFSDKGIQIKTDNDDGGEASGAILYCEISENLGDGLRIEGHVDLKIRECRFTNNQQSGISAPSLQPRHGEKTRIDLQRVLIADNGDVGVNIRIAEPDSGDSSDPPRVRIGMIGVESLRNSDHGLGLDLRYTEDQNIDMKIKIENSRIAENLKSGIYLDADAPGDYSISDTVLEGNKGTGAIYLSGDSSGSIIWLRNISITNGQGYSVLHTGPGLVNLSASFLNSTGPNDQRISSEIADRVTLSDELMTSPPSDLEDANLEMWAGVLRTPKVNALSRDLRQIPLSQRSRPASVIRIQPHPGEITARTSVKWQIIMNTDEVTPRIRVLLDGVKQKILQDTQGETIVVDCPNLTSTNGNLVLEVTIPRHETHSQRSQKFTYDLTKDR